MVSVVCRRRSRLDRAIVHPCPSSCTFRDAVPIYDPSGYQKHRRPKGWGSICPDDLADLPQSLLDSGAADGKEIYNVSGAYALCAQEHRPGVWHGYPIPWSRLPSAARQKLVESGRLDPATYRKAIRKSLGSEFER